MENDTRLYVAELLGTFTLVFIGSISILAAVAANQPLVLVAAFGFGLALLAGLYAFGEISGGHFNPAVSLGLAIAGRFAWADLIGYWIAQVVGGIIAAALVYVIASGVTGFAAGGFASNGYGLYLFRESAKGE